MALIAITWNVWKGTYKVFGQPDPSPTDRIGKIAQIASSNRVAVVCLQEVPANAVWSRSPGGSPAQGPPDAGTPVAKALSAIPAFRRGTWEAWGVRHEMSPKSPRATNRDTGGYLFLYDSKLMARTSHAGYVQPDAFHYGGTYLRPPVGMSFSVKGTPVDVITQHAEADAAHAEPSLVILNNVLDKTHRHTIICADLNIRDINVVGSKYGRKLFADWDDGVTYIEHKKKQGLDHVLCNGTLSLKAVNSLLDFVSDSDHYPVAADCFT